MQTPVALLSSIYYIDGVMAEQGNARWNNGQAYGTWVTVSFSFMDRVPSYAFPDDRNQFAPMNERQMSAAKAALQLWSEVSNIVFVQVSDAGDGGVIRFGTNYQGPSAGYAYYPSSTPEGGDIYIANNSPTFQETELGTWGWLTLVHESGHAVGLKHPGNYNAGSPAGVGGETPFLPASEDTQQYTLMSYNSHPSGLNPVSPMLYDIAAMQYLYGANTTTRYGNDVYRFTAPEVRTIWDAGGIDTFDVSAQTSRTRIDLHAGKFSSIGADANGDIIRNNIGIAYNSAIENAIGGSGPDVIIGNRWPNLLIGGAGNDDLRGEDGQDTLVGGTGDDTMSGGAGNDTFYVDSTRDLIRDVAGYDRVYASTQEAYDYVMANRSAFGIEEVILGSPDFQGAAVEDGGMALHTGTAQPTSTSLAGSELPHDDADDNIRGDAGDDAFNGGYGDDVIDGGGGNDSIVGGSGVDELSGGAGDDVLEGGAGDDTLAGGTGADTLRGGDGDDVYVIDDALDLVVEDGGAPTAVRLNSPGDEVVSSIDYVAPPGVEIVRLSGSAKVSATGNELNNRLVGNWVDNRLAGAAGDDLLLGELGDDTLVGDAGNDTLKGGMDDDVLAGGAGNDVIDGGSGRDTLVLVGVRADYQIRLDRGSLMVSARTGADGVDTVTGVEVLRFTSGDLVIGESDVAALIKVCESLFARHPAESTINGWLAMLEQGRSVQEVAGQLLFASGFGPGYGDVDSGFFAALYPILFDQIAAPVALVGVTSGTEASFAQI